MGSAGGAYEQLEPLSDIGTPMYDVPESGPAKLEYRGLPLDEIEDLLPRSAAYRQAARFLFAQPAAIKGRPLTPLHTGHVAICAVSGILNGVFGAGDGLHVAAWQAVKTVTKSTEKTENGTIPFEQFGATLVDPSVPPAPATGARGRLVLGTSHRLRSYSR